VEMRSKKFTPSQIAKKMGTSRQQIYNIESGRNHPTIKTLEKYAKAVGARLAIVPVSKRA